MFEVHSQNGFDGRINLVTDATLILSPEGKIAGISATLI